MGTDLVNTITEESQSLASAKVIIFCTKKQLLLF